MTYARRFITTWYKNARVHKLHAAGPDWVQTGRAVCGADIRRPGWEWTNEHPPAEKTCKRCRSIVSCEPA